MKNTIGTLFVCALFACGCASTPKEAAEPYRPPKAIYLAQPEYPFELRKAGITGQAIVEYIVSRSGDVVEAHVVKATHPLFGSAAVAAMLKCKYTPGIKGGVAVNTRLQIPISFDLK